MAEQQAASGVVLGRGERSRGGYIPGRGFHSFPFQLIMSSSVHRTTQLDS